MSWGNARTYSNDTFMDFISGSNLNNLEDLKKMIEKNVKENEASLSNPYVKRTFKEIHLGLILYAVENKVVVPKEIREEARTIIKEFLNSDYLESFKSDEKSKEKYQESLDKMEEEFKKGLVKESSFKIHRKNLETVLHDEFASKRKIALIEELNILS